jgi:hypothetical protein
MAIPYRTAKFKSANILAIAILGSTAKFNSRQCFRLYGRLPNYKIRQFLPNAHAPMVVSILIAKFKL